MPIHDWTRVRANRFHHFHQDWTVEIARALNQGVLPEGYWAMAGQRTGGPVPDVIALSQSNRPSLGCVGGVAVADAPPKTNFRIESEAMTYARQASRLTIRHPDGRLIAVIEIVSPGNKDSKYAIRSFVAKAVEFLRAGVHLLIVDLFPPSRRDPQGIHKLIWDYIRDEEYAPPPDKPLTLAAYASGSSITGYIEPIAVGDVMPDMPIFLTPDHYVPVPLESTYCHSWELLPRALKEPLEPSQSPS